jgi:hypothetical protein
LLSFNSESVFPEDVLEYKKFWEELTAYFSFSVTSASDTTSGKELVCVCKEVNNAIKSGGSYSIGITEWSDV